MTRHTRFRIMLATAMLPNFAAYWWLLPRRLKRIRTQMDLMLFMESQYFMKRFVENYRHWVGVRELFESAAPLKIEKADFRIPIQRFQG